MQLQLGFDDWVEEKAIEVFSRAKNELDGWNGEPFIPVDRIARDIFHLDILTLPKEFMGEDITFGAGQKRYHWPDQKIPPPAKSA
ncbi:hypothetical protein L0337_26215 [candidate division KSB1 bacterium]|nr:hypothetical protein [candidate division KSB1 bacterium]